MSKGLVLRLFIARKCGVKCWHVWFDAAVSEKIRNFKFTKHCWGNFAKFTAVTIYVRSKDKRLVEPLLDPVKLFLQEYCETRDMDGCVSESKQK